MQDGKLVLSEGGTAKYKLRYPIEGQQDGQKVKVVTELDFKEGITYRDVKNLLKNADPNDAVGTALIYTAGLTNTPLPILEGLNMWDLTRVQLLTVFFVM